MKRAIRILLSNPAALPRARIVRNCRLRAKYVSLTYRLHVRATQTNPGKLRLGQRSSQRLREQPMVFSIEQYSVAGKVAIVTGAGGRGNSIGRAYAQGLAKAGASVVVADLNADGAKAV